MATTQIDVCGEVRPGVVYDLRRFSEVTGIKEAGLRRMRRQGLVVKYIGRKGFIKSDDFLAFLEANGQTERGH